MDLNKFGKRAYTCALKRGKIKSHKLFNPMHEEALKGIQSEVQEFKIADEKESSEHLPQYSEAIEELSDIVIACMTELYRRNVNIEEVLHAKMKFNENREH